MTKREQKIFNDHYMAAMEKAPDTGAEDDLKIAREIKKVKRSYRCGCNRADRKC